MNNLYNKLKMKLNNMQNRQEKKRVATKITAICCAFALAVILWGYLHDPYGKVYTIEDENYVYTLMNQSIPVSIDISDDLWGTVKIDSIEEILAYYEMMYNLPVTTKPAETPASPRRTVNGAIHFLESPSIFFTADTYIVRDGITYGSEFTEHQVSSMTDKLCDYFYNTRNLGELIGSYNRVVLRKQSQRFNLTVNQKSRLKELVLQGEKIENSGDLSGSVRNRGGAECQIEIYSSDIQKNIPQIYIVVFESGLCQVYDVDNTIGSIMFFTADTSDFLSVFAQSFE